MECPYCAETIKNEAIVCKNCGRDLKIVRPIVHEIRGLTSEIDALHRTLGRLNMQISFHEAPLRAILRHAAIHVLPPIVLLVLAH